MLGNSVFGTPGSPGTSCNEGFVLAIAISRDYWNITMALIQRLWTLAILSFFPGGFANAPPKWLQCRRPGRNQTCSIAHISFWGEKEMYVDSSAGKSRFHIGDLITLVGSGFHNGEQGNVVGVIADSVDHIHRYHVRFSNGKSATFFGSDLQLISPD